MGQNVSVGMLETAVRGEDAHRCFFVDPADRRIEAFRALNGLQSPGQTLSPGRMVVVPHDDSMSEMTAAELGRFSQGVGSVSPPVVSPAQAGRFNQDFSLIDAVVQHREGLGFIGSELDGVNTYLAKRIAMIEADMKRLDEAYRTALKAGWKLNSAEAIALRKPIETVLQRQINGFSRRYILENPGQSRMKKALGLSHKSLAKSYAIDGDGLRNKKIERSLARNSNFAAKLKPLGRAATILQTGAIAAETRVAYQRGALPPPAMWSCAKQWAWEQAAWALEWPSRRRS